MGYVAGSHRWGKIFKPSDFVTSEDVTFYKRPSSPEPFRNTVGLDDGDDLDGAERFPRVWPRAG